MQDVSCHLGQIWPFCFFLPGHSGGSKSGSMMKRLRFDAFDDLKVLYVWVAVTSKFAAQRLRRLSSFVLSNFDDAQNADIAD